MGRRLQSMYFVYSVKDNSYKFTYRECVGGRGGGGGGWSNL